MTCCCESQVLAETESVCPECLARIPARRVARGDDVYLEKTCPRHGDFSAVVWRGAPAYGSWVRPKTPGCPEKPFTAVAAGCPFDCGLCSDHRQQTCCVLFEVTQRCDLRCPVCFAAAGAGPGADPDLATIAGWYRRLLDAGGPFNIQLSGGEPCLRDDLPEIIALGRSLGFTFFQVNTNGLRLGRDAAYLRRLVEAGLNTVFLQFDGTRDEIYTALRGRPLLAEKRAAVERCAAQGLGIVLVPTVVPGVNADDLGGIISFALQHAPAVRGVNLQPISYFGRYPQAPADADRITLPEVMRAIEAQTGGTIRAENLTPTGAKHARCAFHGNFVQMPGGRLVPLTRHAPAQRCCDGPGSAARSREFIALHWSAPASEGEPPAAPGSGLGEWETLLARAQTHGFYISAAVFQDAWTLELEALRECSLHVLSPDGRLIPFCAYNLTDHHGRPLYRNGQRAPHSA